MACGYEISVPATKTYVNQLVVFMYMAMRISGQNTAKLHSLPSKIEETINLVDARTTELASVLSEKNDLYCVGFGTTYPTALEGALKLKEITYAHCEGLLSTEFKHGPLSIVEDNYPVIFITGPDDVPIIVSGINETTCRGGYTIAIGESDSRLKSNANYLISLPISGPLINSILSILPMQLLSYRMSTMRDINPDFPRNLSKTLTVD